MRGNSRITMLGVTWNDAVSLVIPCYAQAQHLSDAIESATVQGPCEIFVVDDGSPDDVAAVVQRYDSISYVRQANSGVAAARNDGLQRVKSEYVVFLDADDRLLPGALKAGLDSFSGSPSRGGGLGRVHVHRRIRRPLHRDRA
jgi:glycosyltransferase involved in cell wall biosynthesis